MIEHEILTLANAAQLLGRNGSEVRRLAATGAIPAVKLNGRWLFSQLSLEQWAKEHPHKTYKLNVPIADIIKMVEGKTYAEVAPLLGITASTLADKLRRAGYIRKRGRRKITG